MKKSTLILHIEAKTGKTKEERRENGKKSTLERSALLKKSLRFDKAAYNRTLGEGAPRSPLLRNCLAAFLVGGGICLFAEALYRLFLSLALPDKMAGQTVSVILIFLTALLTALGIFDSIGRFAGAGTLVPVTGFANAVVSPAIDTKSEGLVLGVGAKIFTVAGPVLLFGVFSGAVYGLLYYLFLLIF